MKRTRQRTITIEGVTYDISYSSQFDGFVTDDDRVVFFDDRICPTRLLETAIHEGLHMSEPKMTEERVTRVAKNVRRLLWAMGYRMSDRTGKE